MGSLLFPADLRTRRISKFCDTLSLALYAHAFECDLPRNLVEPYMNRMFSRMIYEEGELPLTQLLELLTNPMFVDDVREEWEISVRKDRRKDA